MADKAAQDMQAMKLRDRSEESAREEVRVLKLNPHLKIFLSSPRPAETTLDSPPSSPFFVSRCTRLST
jgi:hypothetical protein